MPIYEYRCVSCHRTVEVIQKFSDPPLETCEHCSGKLEKQFSRTSFQLKGGGWFGSGYGGSTVPSADKDSSSKDGPKDGSEGKSEGKSDGKSKEKDQGSAGGSDAAPSTPSTPSTDH